MLKLNHRFDHLEAAISSACKSPLSFTWEWIIIIACCVLGLLWAAVNIWLVLKINVREGKTGDKEDDSKTNTVTPHQKELLIELGTKISEVTYFSNLGSQIIPQGRVSHLPNLRSHHVLHHHLLD